MPFQIIPFHPDLLAQAGNLLALRHQRDRVVLPELPARFESSAIARRAVEATLKREKAGGVAALDKDGKLLAYLIGEKVIDNLWGRSGWIRSAGCAYDPDCGVEIVRDLYAVLGANWVEEGIFFHFALIPVSDPALLHAWFSLSFGIEQIHALQDLNTLISTPVLPDGIEIRQANRGDRQSLAEMSDVIWKTQVQAPCWGIMLPERVQEDAEGWTALADAEDVTVWLAIQNGVVIGTQGYWKTEPTADNLLLPENCTRMSIAGTREEVRGQGIGTALTQHGLHQARAMGFRFCETDWRSTNLLASRFWTRQGFRPMMYRLVRRIDSRIAWAKGKTL